MRLSASNVACVVLLVIAMASLLFGQQLTKPKGVRVLVPVTEGIRWDATGKVLTVDSNVASDVLVCFGVKCGTYGEWSKK